MRKVRLFRGRGRRPLGGRGRGGDRPWQIVHESSQICTNSICIREIHVNSWTVNWRFARTRNGAGRRSRKPACAGRESGWAARRDTKTLRPSLEWMEHVGRSKEEVVRSKCGRFIFFCFSLLLVLLCGARSARVFFVAKANEARGQTQVEQSGSRTRGQLKKNSA